MNIQDKLKGPVFSIITPFKGEDIDYDGLCSYIQYLYDNGAKLFYAMAFNTRYLLMSEEEILKVNEVVIKKVKSFEDPETLVIVGDPLDCSTETSIQFAEHAKYFSQRGMVTILADYRVSSRHDVKVINPISDGKTSIKWIKENADLLGVDKNRIVASGGSAGGHLAASTALLSQYDDPKEKNNKFNSIPSALILFNPCN